MLQSPPSSDLVAQAAEVIEDIRRAVQEGERHWFFAVLDGIGRWPLAEEQVNGRRYSYLIGNEAFDWLLLAERLCSELADLTPIDEREALLRRRSLPVETTDDDFRRYLGAAKYRAHLNFVYGVHVEEALQLCVEQEVRKERLSCVWKNGQIDDEVCDRLYGDTRARLRGRFRRERARASAKLNGGSRPDPREFTYWLFKRRVDQCDPARVASDTRKGLAMLARTSTSPFLP